MGNKAKSAGLRVFRAAEMTPDIAKSARGYRMTPMQTHDPASRSFT
jgi:hypothetical protein